MLPNSIERTAPILGYDPYAFIMGKKSNFNGVNPAVREGGLDYFAKNPEYMYTNKEKVKRRFNLKSIVKGILTIAGIAAGGVAIAAGSKKIKTIPAAPSTPPKSGSSISSSIKGAGGSISNGLHSAGSFISDKFHTASDFLKRKFSRP